ncbi:MAG: hypothetical protein JSW43_08945, partial [Gemmatimonadota bacterium]
MLKRVVATVAVLALVAGCDNGQPELFAPYEMNFSTSSLLSTAVRTYTLNADFDEGALFNVNHDIADQLQLDAVLTTFPFIWVAASGRGTVIKINTETGEILGQYRSAPTGRGLDPSRTTVDLDGNVWTGNRAEQDFIDGLRHGSVVKIGLITGGTRVDAGGSPD